ncbi:MAG TPA: hypothetical protein VGE44_15320 [Daejeonella sp.]|uniref:hypothetical protein n=1 Tax=Daejeonella sp. TaxID=2805397 RepID=UPI002ED7C6D2
MDEEKFDKNLKDKIQKFDVEYAPLFNKDQIWKGIKKGERRRNGFLIAAASLILILGLSILFQQSKKFVEIAKKQKPAIKSSKVIELPQTKARTVEIVSNKSEEQKTEISNIKPSKKEVINSINQSIVVFAVTDNIIQRVDSTQAGFLKIEEPVEVKNELPVVVKDVESEIKVIFKRGDPINTGLPPDSKLAFKRFKIRIFEIQTSDTSAYASGVEVEPEKKFRIKF